MREFVIFLLAICIHNCKPQITKPVLSISYFLLFSFPNPFKLNN